MMETTGVKLFISLLFVGALYPTDAAIAWTKPKLSGAANGDGTLSIKEDQATATTIETYAATGDAAVTFALTPPVSPFALTAAGALTITAALDHDTTPTYTLHIEATDGTNTGTATITVTVTDVTDVKEPDPVFSAASYSSCIADKSPADSTLTTVTATVQDTSDTITYAIASGNTGSDFKIDPSTGLIQVNSAKTLDKATTASNTLVVTATVATDRTGTTTVSVTVADSCDKGDNGDKGDKGDNGDKGDKGDNGDKGYKGDNGHSGTVVAAVSMMILIVSLFVTLF